jgi:hypothetical protein
METKLKATRATAARIEAGSIEPLKEKTLKGYSETGKCVYISCVRAAGNKARVATARIPGEALSYFIAEIK